MEPKTPGQVGHDHVLGEQHALHTEGPADIGCHDPYVLDRNLEQRRELFDEAVHGLVAAPHRQVVVLVAGEAAEGLEREGREALAGDVDGDREIERARVVAVGEVLAVDHVVDHRLEQNRIVAAIE